MSESESEEPKTAQVDNVAPPQPQAYGKKPATLDQKRKVWTRRIVGLIVLFSLLGCVAMLIAAQAVSNLFKVILGP